MTVRQPRRTGETTAVRPVRRRPPLRAAQARTVAAAGRGRPDDATADYLNAYFEPTGRAIDGLEKTLVGLGLLDDALPPDLRKPQNYFNRVWSTAFRATDLADAGSNEPDEYSDTCTADGDAPEQDAA